MMMKNFSPAFVLAFLLVSLAVETDARLNGKHHSTTNVKEPSPSPTHPPAPMPEQRSVNHVHFTLTNVDTDALTSEEDMYLEDTFLATFEAAMEAFQHEGGQTDFHVRSMIVTDDGSGGNAEGNHDRSLYLFKKKRNSLFKQDDQVEESDDDAPTGLKALVKSLNEQAANAEKEDSNEPEAEEEKEVESVDDEEEPKIGAWFDIWALFEWSCHLCGRTAVDDDWTDDDYYYNGRGGGRHLQEDFVPFFEDLLCETLREGPFAAFHNVGECTVTLSD